MQHSRGELAACIGSQATCDMTRGVVSVTCSMQDVCSRQDGRRRMQQAGWKMQHANRMVYAQQMVLATPVPPACTPVIGWAVEVARGGHLQAPAHAAGRRPAYCRRTACPCRLPLLSSLLPQITIMLTNERCPSATERNGGVWAAPVSAATARCAKPDPCAMSRSIPAVESSGSCDHSRVN